MSGLKSKLNAVAAQAAAQVKSEQEGVQEYRTNALREYPRLVAELLAMCHRSLDGTDNLKIVEKQVEQTLTMTLGALGWSSERGNYDDTRKEVLGKVTVPEWTIYFLGKHMSFVAAGLGHLFGAYGAIEVSTDHRNPFPKGQIFISSPRDRTDVWHLVVESGHVGQQDLPLTEELLSEIFDSYFAAKLEP